MPRVSKSYQCVLRSLLGSRRYNEVSQGAALLYVHTLLATDDFGRMPGTAFEVFASCFAKRGASGDVALPDVQAWIHELRVAGLLEAYTVEGEEFLQVAQYEEPTGGRQTARFPGPEEGEPIPMSPNGGHDGTDSGTGRPQTGDTVSPNRGQPPSATSDPLGAGCPQNARPSPSPSPSPTTSPEDARACARGDEVGDVLPGMPGGSAPAPDGAPPPARASPSKSKSRKKPSNRLTVEQALERVRGSPKVAGQVEPFEAWLRARHDDHGEHIPERTLMASMNALAEAEPAAQRAVLEKALVANGTGKAWLGIRADSIKDAPHGKSRPFGGGASGRRGEFPEPPGLGGLRVSGGKYGSRSGGDRKPTGTEGA